MFANLGLRHAFRLSASEILAATACFPHHRSMASSHLMPLIMAKPRIAVLTAIPNSTSHFSHKLSVLLPSLTRILPISLTSQSQCVSLSGHSDYRCSSLAAGLALVTQPQQQIEAGHSFRRASVDNSDDEVESHFSALQQLIHPGNGEPSHSAADREVRMDEEDVEAAGRGRRGPTRARRKTSRGSGMAVQANADDSPPPTPTPAAPLPLARLVTLTAGHHPIRKAHVPTHVWNVLRGLRNAGFESYIVGGSLRDLFLGGEPKDFDILSTALPKQVKKCFGSRARVVGRRFPICHVHSGPLVVEVSSFSSEAVAAAMERRSERGRRGRRRRKSGDAAVRVAGSSRELPTTLHEEEVAGLGFKGDALSPAAMAVSVAVPDELLEMGEWTDRDSLRWLNACTRDFTVNALMLDPFSGTLYDYVGALTDIKHRRVRTIVPATRSFEEDPIRAIRAIRVAARSNLKLHADVADALRHPRTLLSLITMNKCRLQQELAVLLSHGSSARSLLLLHKTGLLPLLLPLQAEQLSPQALPSVKRAFSAFAVEHLFKGLDKHASPQAPCEPIAWVCLLALHLAVTHRPWLPEAVLLAGLRLKRIRQGSWREESTLLVERMGGRGDWGDDGEGEEEVMEKRSERGVEDRLEMEARELLQIAEDNVSKMIDSEDLLRSFYQQTSFTVEDPTQLTMLTKAQSSDATIIFHEARRKKIRVAGWRDTSLDEDAFEITTRIVGESLVSLGSKLFQRNSERDTLRKH